MRKNKLSVLSPSWIEYSIVEYAVKVNDPVNTEIKKDTKILEKPTVLWKPLAFKSCKTALITKWFLFICVTQI